MNTKGASKIYLVRHGECTANVKDMNLSPDIDKITEKGIQQSALLGKHLQNELFTKAYASTYPRALDTAKEIISHLKTPKPQLVEDDRIREREMGEFENKPMRQVFNALFSAAKNGTKMLEFEVPGGESVQHLEQRIGSFLEHLLQVIRDSEQPQNILVVTHGVIIMRMMLKLRFWSKEPSRGLALNSFVLNKTIIPIKNAAYHVLTVTNDPEDACKIVVDLTKLHEAGHLDPLKPKVPVKPSKDVQEITETFMELVDQQCTTV